MVNYYEFMEKRYGKKLIAHLKKENQKILKYKKSELEYMRKTFKAKIKELI